MWKECDFRYKFLGRTCESFSREIRFIANSWPAKLHRRARTSGLSQSLYRMFICLLSSLFPALYQHHMGWAVIEIFVQMFSLGRWFLAFLPIEWCQVAGFLLFSKVLINISCFRWNSKQSRSIMNANTDICAYHFDVLGLKNRYDWRFRFLKLSKKFRSPARTGSGGYCWAKSDFYPTLVSAGNNQNFNY